MIQCQDPIGWGLGGVNHWGESGEEEICQGRKDWKKLDEFLVEVRFHIGQGKHQVGRYKVSVGQDHVECCQSLGGDYLGREGKEGQARKDLAEVMVQGG